MEARGIGKGRGDGRRFSQPESGGGPKVSTAETGFAIKNEEKVKSNSSKFRVYDKNFLPDKVSPLKKIAELENAINNLQQLATEGVQQEADIIKQYKCKITGVALKKQNEMLQKELDSTKCLLEKQNQRAEKSMAENVRLDKQVEELSIKFGKLQETHDIILHEKEEQRMKFESLHADLQNELSSLAAAKMSLENERNSLQSEMDRRLLFSEEEKVNLKDRLRELETALDSANNDLECCRAMDEKKEGQIFDLRRQVVDLQNELLGNAEANTFVKQTSNCLMSEMDKCREENGHLPERIRELESALNCAKEDLESKDVMIVEMTERQKSIANGVADRKSPSKVASKGKKQRKCMSEMRICKVL